MSFNSNFIYKFSCIEMIIIYHDFQALRLLLNFQSHSTIKLPIINLSPSIISTIIISTTKEKGSPMSI